MILRYAYHKPFKVRLPNKHEWHNGFNPDNKAGPVWYIDGSKTYEETGVVVYKWGSKKGHSFSLGLHTTAFQAEIYVTKVCIMDYMEKCYKDRNIYILSDSQEAIKALNNFHQSLVKLAQHNRTQLIWVPGHMGIDGNAMADQLPRQGSLHPLIGPELALGISTKVTREMIRGCMHRNNEEYWQSVH
jgi:ribonuclease HI